MHRMFDLKLRTCFGPGPSSLNSPIHDKHLKHANFKCLSFKDFFPDIPQRLAVSVCKPQGGAVSSQSLHRAGQSSQNRSLVRRGNETRGCQTDAFASRGQQKREKKKPWQISNVNNNTDCLEQQSDQDTSSKAEHYTVPGDNMMFVKCTDVFEDPKIRKTEWNLGDCAETLPPACFTLTQTPTPGLYTLYNWPNGLHMEER